MPFDFSEFEEKQMSDDTDAKIVMKAIFDNKPSHSLFWSMLMADKKTSLKIQLQIKNFDMRRNPKWSKKVLEFKKNESISTITNTEIDKFVHKHIIINGLITNAVKQFWIGSEIESRYKYCIGRGRWLTLDAYMFFKKYNREPYSIK